MGPINPNADKWFVMSEARTKAYAALTGDYNLLHLDSDFAARTVMRRPIVHGTASMVHALTAIRDYIGEAAFLKGSVTVKFIKPVYVGQKIRIEISANSSVETAFQVVREDGEIALVGAMTHEAEAI